MSGSFGPRHIFGNGSRNPHPFGRVFTGVACPFCRGDGQFVIDYDGGATRWGVDGYYIACSNIPKQGAQCPWMESLGAHEGKYISEELARKFEANIGNLSAMVGLIRIALPDLGRVPLQKFEHRLC